MIQTPCLRQVLGQLSGNAMHLRAVGGILCCALKAANHKSQHCTLFPLICMPGIGFRKGGQVQGMVSHGLIGLVFQNVSALYSSNMLGQFVLGGQATCNKNKRKRPFISQSLAILCWLSIHKADPHNLQKIYKSSL